jgi:hypothetical protein
MLLNSKRMKFATATFCAVDIADQVVPFLLDCCSHQLQICKSPGRVVVRTTLLSHIFKNPSEEKKFESKPKTTKPTFLQSERNEHSNRVDMNNF